MTSNTAPAAVVNQNVGERSFIHLSNGQAVLTAISGPPTTEHTAIIRMCNVFFTWKCPWQGRKNEKNTHLTCVIT